ncbi:MAG: prephenate dehydratase [Nitrospirae bacterium]|nr:prephenate dehydratase [Nitrospirota bacterium]
MKKANSSLAKIREQIDKVDQEIIKLLNKRAELAIDVAAIKRKADLKFHSPEREREVIEKVSSTNKGPFPNDALKFIFREIISASLSLEEPLRVAYLGPEGTFTHLAALRHFGSSAKCLPVQSIRSVFDAVESCKADYGLVPIENSNEGVVSYTLDMFMDNELKISAEVLLEVTHNLLSQSGELKKVKKIYSHPQAVAQCKRWIETNLPGVPVLEATSTARAAELTAKHADSAAIASELSARLYDLKFVEKRIEDNKHNMTRFLVISKEFPKKSRKDKTSIMFSLQHKPGSLYDALNPFEKSGINLTKIESRPSRRKAWEYIFFVDLEGHIDDEKVRKAIEKVKKSCLFLKHLGSYPSHEKPKNE